MLGLCSALCRRAKRSVRLAGADPAALSKVAELATERIEGILRNSDLDKTSRARALQQAKADVLQQLREEGGCPPFHQQLSLWVCTKPGRGWHGKEV